MNIEICSNGELRVGGYTVLDDFFSSRGFLDLVEHEKIAYALLSSDCNLLSERARELVENALIVHREHLIVTAGFQRINGDLLEMPRELRKIRRLKERLSNSTLDKLLLMAEIWELVFRGEHDTCIFTVPLVADDITYIASVDFWSRKDG